ncbi:MAG: DUF4942 domain-containing protein [Sphaerochaeta sp.]|nr:DUF4942 domain-containing protein [Sphaerochaeta sp.]
MGLAHRLAPGQGLPKRPEDAVTAINQAIREYRTEAETEYFRFKWFKAGTMHIWFKGEDLLKEFNRIGAAGHADLPG